MAGGQTHVNVASSKLNPAGQVTQARVVGFQCPGKLHETHLLLESTKLAVAGQTHLRFGISAI